MCCSSDSDLQYNQEKMNLFSNLTNAIPRLGDVFKKAGSIKDPQKYSREFGENALWRILKMKECVRNDKENTFTFKDGLTSKGIAEDYSEEFIDDHLELYQVRKQLEERIEHIVNIASMLNIKNATESDYIEYCHIRQQEIKNRQNK